MRRERRSGRGVPDIAGRERVVTKESPGLTSDSPDISQGVGRRFIDALKMFCHVANIGDARSLAIHPATITHSRLSPEERLATGVTEGYVRLSIGIEHHEDILAAVPQALKAA